MSRLAVLEYPSQYLDSVLWNRSCREQRRCSVGEASVNRSASNVLCSTVNTPTDGKCKKNLRNILLSANTETTSEWLEICNGECFSCNSSAWDPVSKKPELLRTGLDFVGFPTNEKKSAWPMNYYSGLPLETYLIREWIIFFYKNRGDVWQFIQKYPKRD